MDKYTVYMHVNKINQKKYIGITKQKPQDRWGHNGNNYKESSHFYAAIQKYGWDNFEHIILYTNLSQEQACEIEIKLIADLKTQDKRYGYNILSGGTAPSLPQEVRDKISNGLKGNKNGLGKPCSEEKKQKISAAQKGRPFTEEHKKKISQAKKGKSTGPCSEAKRQNIIKNKKDKKPIVCVETGIEYESIQECARQLGLYATNICKVLKGKIHSTGGLHFKYKNNDI